LARPPLIPYRPWEVEKGRKMRGVLLLLLSLFAATPAAAADRVYEEGQIWSIGLSGNDGVLLKIRKIEDYGPGKVYHVSLTGLHLAGGQVTQVQHLPLSRETLDASLVAIVAAPDTFPDFHEGYEEWKRARGGVFTIPLAQILDILEQSFASQLH
jgi:hypothetical protein